MTDSPNNNVKGLLKELQIKTGSEEQETNPEKLKATYECLQCKCILRHDRDSPPPTRCPPCNNTTFILLGKKYTDERDKKIQQQKINETEKINLSEDVMQKLLKKERDLATELMVNHITSLRNIYSTRNNERSEMWVYKEGIYIREARTYINEICREILHAAYTTQFSNAVADKIEADTYVDDQDFFKTENIEEIPVNNGILNLKTRQLTPFTPTKIFFSKLPMDYNPEATCENISKHFNEVLSSQQDVKVLEEVFGSILLKDYRIEKAIMMLGDGRNGKGKTHSIMKAFVGQAYSVVALKNMKEDNFRVIDMHRQLVNLSGELSSMSLKETGCLKMLIGRDPINADRKHLNGITFVNHATIIFAANELPRVYDNTAGFWDKWVLLDFPYKFIRI